MDNIDIDYVRKCTELILSKTNNICGIVTVKKIKTTMKGDVMLEV